MHGSESLSEWTWPAIAVKRQKWFFILNIAIIRAVLLMWPCYTGAQKLGRWKSKRSSWKNVAKQMPWWWWWCHTLTNPVLIRNQSVFHKKRVTNNHVIMNSMQHKPVYGVGQQYNIPHYVQLNPVVFTDWDHRRRSIFHTMFGWIALYSRIGIIEELEVRDWDYRRIGYSSWKPPTMASSFSCRSEYIPLCQEMWWKMCMQYFHPCPV